MHKEAIRCYDECLKINPNDGHVHVGKGFSLLRLRRPKESVKYFIRGLKLNSCDSYAYAGKGFVFAQLGKHKEADKWFKLARQVDPRMKYLLDS